MVPSARSEVRGVKNQKPEQQVLHCIWEFARCLVETSAVVSSLSDPTTSENPYNELKAAILDRESKSVMQRVDSVLKDIHMGDRKPSDYFAYLKETAGESFTEEAVYQIWLSRIPRTIKTTLIVLKSELLKYRLSIADELAEANVEGAQVAAVSKKDELWEDFRKVLLKEVKNMCRDMCESRERDKSRGRSNSRSRGPRRGQARDGRSKSRGPKKECHRKWNVWLCRWKGVGNNRQ